MADRPDLSVILPTFNERDNIVPLIQDIQKALGSIPHEVLVVDDRSPDGTAAVARAAAGDDARIRVIERTPPAGLTVSLLDGVRQATGTFVTWLDCDFSHPPEMLPAMFKAVGADRMTVATASRYVPGGADERDSAAARVLSHIINWLARTFVDRRVTDYTTGYVMAPRDLVLDLGLTGDYGEYCITLLANAARRGCRMVELPYRSIPRRSGASKTATSLFGFAKRGWPYLVTVARLARNGSR
jgi:dolichol-phosphate mannosyltransferase